MSKIPLKIQRALCVVSRFSLLGVFALLVVLPTARAVPSIELPPWWWTDGSGGFSGNFNYFQSKTNFTDTRGNMVALPTSNSYTSYEGTLRARYSFHPLISVYGGVSYADAIVQNGTNLTNNGQINTAQISAGFFGVDFKLPFRWIRVIPEIEGGSSVQQLDVNSTIPLTSDDSPYVRASLFLNKPVHIGPTLLELYAHGGLYYPSQNLAKLFMYGVGGELYFSRRFAIGGGVEGYETVISDALAEADRNRIVVDTDGGSYRYDTYNPALLDGKGWLRWNVTNQMSVRGTYTQSITGVRAANGQMFSLFVSFDFPASGVIGVRPPLSMPVDPAHQQQWQNQRLFDDKVRQERGDSFEADDFPEAVAPAAPPAPLPTTPPPPRSTPPSSDSQPTMILKRKKSPPPTENHSLDEAEQILEQKHKK